MVKEHDLGESFWTNIPDFVGNCPEKVPKARCTKCHGFEFPVKDR
ncbi:MAG: hypothetical protein WAV16_01125 [Candidatus Moraniibacteriota bacterium]